MKTTLAITGVLLAAVAANAANINVTGKINPVVAGNIGSITGGYNTTTSKLSIGTSDTSPTGAVTKITLTGPGGLSYNSPVVIPGPNKSYFGYFVNVSAPGFTTFNANKYIVSFYVGSTLVAQSAKGLVAAPEPQTYAMAAGAALVGFAAFRRVRR